ncbi:hypothetical protein KKF84_12390 [Myxococcota bacterium]|nr:hypothetical protein [Myxococcota bacterium]
MFRTLLIAALALGVTAATISEASAQGHMSRRHRLHSRWISGVGTSYLSAGDYDSCWAASQRAIAPSAATIDFRFRACLSRNRIHAVRRKHVRRRIRSNCRVEASRVMLPSEVQQQNYYVTCLRRTRYNYIRNYLETVTCDYLVGHRRSRCIAKLHRDIASYGYNSVAHLNYLDSLYRTRYNNFRTRYPKHRFVKRYHKIHHSRRHTPARHVVKRHTPARRVVKRHTPARRTPRRVVRREVRRETRRAVKREVRRETRKAVKREVRRERRKAVKREVRRDRKKRR